MIRIALLAHNSDISTIVLDVPLVIKLIPPTIAKVFALIHTAYRVQLLDSQPHVLAAKRVIFYQTVSAVFFI